MMGFRSMLLFFLVSFELFAQAPRGIIQREYLNRPATDLVYNGQVLLPEEAHELYISNKGHLDLADLNPVTDTDIWNDTYPNNLKDDSNTIEINNMDSVTYETPIAAQSGNFRFNVTKENQFGVPVIYNMLISKKTHGLLLARALMRKVGYFVPAMKYLNKVKINFKEANDKLKFKALLEHDTLAGDAESWIVSELDDGSIIVQDLVVMEGFSPIYNLAMGPITDDIINGRRLLSSLSLPLAITNMDESVNMFRWQAGSVNNNAVALNLENADIFQTSWEDARWILKRISQLDRSDFEQIVKESHTPPAVQMILVEKVIGRRNNLMKLFKIDSPLIKVDDEVSYGVELVKGKLTQENWPGYGSRFAYGDPDSPLATSEITAWIKSKVIQTAIDGAMSLVNWKLGNDVDKINADEFQKYFEKNQAASQTNGPGFHMPVGAWWYPSISGNLLVTRNITTGTFMGTDNLINLVDGIGFQINLGINTSGILYPSATKEGPTTPQGKTIDYPIPVNFGAKAEVTYSRSWVHLRPVTSIEKALKYPFKNILVPMVKRQYGKKLSSVMSLDIDNMTEEERVAKVTAAIKELTKELEVGESFIVTDSVILGASGTASYNYMNLIKLQLGIGGSQTVVGRFHIHRRSENTIHIYRDFGNVRSLKINLSADSVIPVINIGGKFGSGEARTKYYQVSLNPNSKDAVATLAALRSAFLTSSLKKLEKIQKPYILKHKFAEKQFNAGIFTWQFNMLRSHTRMSIQHPKGDEREFFRAYYGKSSGMNYQDYAMRAISEVLGTYVNFNFNSSQSSSNPGYSFYGKAKNKLITYEGEINKSTEKLERPFMRLTRIWNGWSIKVKNAKKILEKIKNRYRFEFYEPTVLNDTQKLSLYNISVNLFVYEKGIEHLKNLDEKTIKNIFANYQVQKDPKVNPVIITDKDIEKGKKLPSNSGIVRFLRRIKKAKHFAGKHDYKKETQWMIRAFSIAELKINAQGLSILFGGNKNFYITSRIDGFRVGDENGDKPGETSLYSNTLGEIGSKEPSGPLQGMLQSTEMLEGEFFIYWLMTRII